MIFKHKQDLMASVTILPNRGGWGKKDSLRNLGISRKPVNTKGVIVGIEFHIISSARDQFAADKSNRNAMRGSSPAQPDSAFRAVGDGTVKAQFVGICSGSREYRRQL